MFASQHDRVLFAIVASALLCGTAFGQGTGNNNVGGISVDAEGVVSRVETRPQSSRAAQAEREAFAAERLPGEMQVYSDLRKVSLVKLERAYADAIGSGEPVPEDMQHLAGLQRIDLIFIDPEGGDIVVAGPAEGFAPDGEGRMLGLGTGRPPIRLDDLIVALRSVLTGRSEIGVSIDPQQERLAALQQYLRRNSSPTSPARARRRYQQMSQILGPQEVSIWGVPEDSHFARVLVEADYLMKRISLGVEPAGVQGIRSHLSLLQPNGNSMQRWWFVPYYEGIYASEDGDSFELVGQRAQVLAQEEWVDVQGARGDAAFTRATTERFAELFTEHFAELAEERPVFAEMQNLFDRAVLAALLERTGAMERAGWRANVFLDPAQAEYVRYAVPRHVPSEVMTRPARRGVMLGLLGGVTLVPHDIVARFESRGGERGEHAAGARARALAQPQAEQTLWWWD